MEPTDRESLIAAVRRGERFRFRYFWGHRPRPDGQLSDSCLSQWWRADFEVDGQSYSSAEQFMMAEKARVFGDELTREQVLNVHDPAAIKQLGRAVRDFDIEVWEKHSFEIVVAGNVAKFSQCPRLTSYLLSTTDEVLVEASPTDVVWGIGATRGDPTSRHPDQWRGLNLLGFALMRARREIQQQRRQHRAQ